MERCGESMESTQIIPRESLWKDLETQDTRNETQTARLPRQE
jgi:hypothetical protein